MYFRIFGALALLALSALSLTFGVGLFFESIRRASRLPKHRRAGKVLSSVGGCLCAAVFAFTYFYRPSLEYAVESAQVEYTDDDDDGDPDTAARALHRQLKKIRRGEPVETLTVRL
jgi:hypothetical protein